MVIFYKIETLLKNYFSAIDLKEVKWEHLEDDRFLSVEQKIVLLCRESGIFLPDNEKVIIAACCQSAT